MTHYRAVLDQKPDYVAARLALAALLSAAGRHAQALDELRQALQVQPENALIHESIGDAEMARGRAAEAFAAYARALENSPDPAARKRIRAKMRNRP
jgi:tetratricopeptide (TPR) repeat protein